MQLEIKLEHTTIYWWLLWQNLRFIMKVIRVIVTSVLQVKLTININNFLFCKIT